MDNRPAHTMKVWTARLRRVRQLPTAGDSRAPWITLRVTHRAVGCY
jgi:hypothetical protein